MQISPETVAYELKEKTHASHTETEKLLMPKFSSIGNADDYAAILRMFYGYFHPLEELVQSLITSADLPDIHERRNSRHILNDLYHLGRHQPPVRIATNMPSLTKVEEAFGALYVMEGSTLGGRYLYKMLKNRHSSWITSDMLSFFNGYGEDTGSKWTSFQQVLDNYPDSNPIVTAANETFYNLKNWIRQTLYHE